MSPIVLVGCGKTKRPEPTEACNLYTGGLFRARRAYAESRSPSWWVISALYGLVAPGVVLAPYDLTIKDLAPIDRAAWSLSVAGSLLSELPDAVKPRDLSVEIHAGAAYAQQLRDVLVAIGVRRVWLPLEGLGVGEQLAWYREAARRGELGLGPQGAAA